MNLTPKFFVSRQRILLFLIMLVKKFQFNGISSTYFVCFQNSENKCHFSTSLTLQEIGSKSGLRHTLRMKFAHRETKERNKSLSRTCPIGVLLSIDIFAMIFNDLCA